jgi:ParB/Sulfiredoxin domain
MASTGQTPRPALAIHELPIDDLRPDPANPRRISDAELEALARSIREFGFVEPVVARRQDRTVIGGHQRLLTARRLGLKTVPVVLVDLSLEQARVLNLALTRSAARGTRSCSHACSPASSPSTASTSRCRASPRTRSRSC